MSGTFESATRTRVEDLGAIALSKSTGARVSDGSAEQIIERPAGTDPARVLYIQADVGDWRLRPGEYRAVTVDSVNTGTDTITASAAHNYETGDGPVRLTHAGTPIGGLAVDTDYWVVVVSATEFQLADTLAKAQATIPDVMDLTSSGTGAQQFGASANGATDGDGWANAADATADIETYGAAKLGQGATIILAAPEKLTVRAYNSGDELTFWFA